MFIKTLQDISPNILWNLIDARTKCGISEIQETGCNMRPIIMLSLLST